MAAAGGGSGRLSNRELIWLIGLADGRIAPIAAATLSATLDANTGTQVSIPRRLALPPRSSCTVPTAQGLHSAYVSD